MDEAPLPNPHRFRYYLTLILLLQAVAVIPFLGQTLLFKIDDEGRIAEISREMALTGDWVVPKLGGEVYACYPPLAYWVEGVSGSIFGFNAFAMRLPGALAGLALVAVVAFTGRRLAGERAGLAGAMVLASLHGFVGQQMVCRADVMLALFAAVAFDRFLALADGELSWRNRAILYGAVALGILAKGPLAIVIPGLGIFAWLLLTRRWSILRDLKPWIGVPAILAVVLPWYYAVYRAAGWGFIDINLIKENFNAFTTGHEQKEPLTYYIKKGPLRFVPWLLFLAMALPLWKSRGFRIALGWAAAVTFFLAVSSSKRLNYLTFLCPAFAIATGIGLDAMWSATPKRVGWTVMGFGIAVGLAAVALLFVPIKWSGAVALVTGYIPAVSGVLIVAAAAVVVVTWLKGPVVGTGGLALLIGLLLVLFHAILAPKMDAGAQQQLAFCRRIESRTLAWDRITALGPHETEGSYYFYIRRNLMRGDSILPGYYVANENRKNELEKTGRTEILERFVDNDGNNAKYFIKVTP